jgi:hypothetical protein
MSRSPHWATPALAIALVLASAPARGDGVHLGGLQDTVSVASGGTVTVDLAAQETGFPFNGFDIVLRYDPARLTFAPMAPVSSQFGPLMTSACANTFHVFGSAPDSLAITLVLLCNGVSVTGPGAIYRVRFNAAATDAYTTLTFGPSTEFYMGGPEVTPLVTRPIVVKIGNPVPVGVPRQAGEGLVLTAARPNPARSEALLRFRLPFGAETSLQIHDAQGRRVRTLVAGPLPSGEHVARWDLLDERGAPVPAGVYFASLTCAGATRNTRLVTLR